MQDHSHLSALELHLSHERSRLVASKTVSDKAFHKVRCEQLEREIMSERKFLGIPDVIDVNVDVDDDTLLEMLGAWK